LSNESDKTKINLLFCNKKEEDILMKDHLTNEKVHVKFLLSSPENKKYEFSGYIDEHMNSFLPQKSENTFCFICGRDSFTSLALKLIQAKGFKSTNDYFIF
jgi:NAD(P)H-flavin reductase